MIDSIRTWIWLQQDYFWFLSGLGWLVVGVSWWQFRKEFAIPGWIGWSALAGVLTAATEILSIVFAKSFVPGPVSFPAEMALGAIEAVLIFGWWYSAMRGRAAQRVIAALVAAVLIFAAYWRIQHPNEAIVLTSLLMGGAIIWWLFGRADESSGWRVAMVAVGVAALLGTGGPASIVTYEPRRLVDMSEVGPWAALAQIGALVVVLVVWPKAAGDESERETNARESRWFWTVAGAWLVFGLLFAVGAGMLGLKEFKRHALERVQLAAQVLEKEPVERLVSDELKVGEVFHSGMATGRRLATESAHVATFGPLVDSQLETLGKAFPDIGLVTLTTLRGGWLALVASNMGTVAKKTHPEHVTLFRRESDRDSRDWSEKRGDFFDPNRSTVGWMVSARAPLLSRSGQMLGWLNLEYSVNNWVAAQAQRRSMAYLVVALGLGIGRQLQNRRSIERSRTRAQQTALAATQANKLKTTFLANVSHELRTPLQTIMGYTDLLLPNATRKDRDRLLAVREHADLMGRLVNDLIDLSAAESGNFHLIERPIALVDHVTQAVESFRPQAELKGLGLNIRAAPQIPNWLKADPQRVRQVVLNLVSNAVKYTDHGQVNVSLELAERRGDEIILEFHVADTGPGVDPAEQEQLFSAFSRLDRTIEREGTGLGLAIVAAVSRAMRGSVWVESDGHSGSHFIARWVLQTATPPASTPRDKVPLRGMRVLIADDNALVRDLFVALLTECGAVCATATDGEEAIQRLYREAFDAVVLDLAMPRLDGISTVRRLRRSMPNHLRRIVGVSAHASAKDHQNALAAGMDAFLVKPVTLPDLARALAPAVTDVPQVDSLQRIKSHFEQRFRTDAAMQTALVAQAWERGQWSDLRAAAHHLKNSADVVGDVELAEACAALEDASRAEDRDAGSDAWVSCKRALIRWLPEPTEH